MHFSVTRGYFIKEENIKAVIVIRALAVQQENISGVTDYYGQLRIMGKHVNFWIRCNLCSMTDNKL